jgi:DNA-binding CsgD family transcriptional regulator
VRRTIILYGLAIAAAAFLLDWLQYQYLVRVFSTEIYIVLIASFFAVLGIWTGYRLWGKRAISAFERNTKALDYLGISECEYDVLALLAEGRSNKEIADGLFVSTNTVKTHLANLYGKLEVNRRTQAVREARELRLIP